MVADQTIKQLLAEVPSTVISHLAEREGDPCLTW